MIHGSNSYTLSDYIRLVGHLPYTPPVLFDTKAESEMFKAKRTKYIAASYWLKNILLGEWLPKDEDWYLFKDLKSTAEHLATYFYLATEVYNNTKNEEILQLHSPASLWFRICISVSEIDSRTSGLLGKPALKGKRESLNRANNIYSQLQALSFQIRNYPTLKNSPAVLVLLEAQEIAKRDRKFYRFHLLPFLKKMRKFSKEMKHNPNYQRDYLLSNGEIILTGKDRKLSSYKP